MTKPQPGLFAQGTRSHRHLELDLRPDLDGAALVEALAPLRQPSVAAGGANIVIGFGPLAWNLLDTTTTVTAWPTIDGIPDTPHDVWVWIHGTGDDVLFDTARAVVALLAPAAVLATETAGYVYHDSRDLTGFIDGTENPGVEDAFEVAIDSAGGSHALVQRWVHDLVSFDALSVPEQERVIGRTKADSVELDATDRPETAHISRVQIEENGAELEIYRRSVPYGTTTEHGLFFVAFSADAGRFDRMLRAMFGHSGDGLRDRLTDFTKPVSNARYYVPSLEALGAALG